MARAQKNIPHRQRWRKVRGFSLCQSLFICISFLLSKTTYLQANAERELKRELSRRFQERADIAPM